MVGRNIYLKLDIFGVFILKCGGEVGKPKNHTHHQSRKDFLPKFVAHQTNRIDIDTNKRVSMKSTRDFAN